MLLLSFQAQRIISIDHVACPCGSGQRSQLMYKVTQQYFFQCFQFYNSLEKQMILQINKRGFYASVLLIYAAFDMQKQYFLSQFLTLLITELKQEIRNHQQEKNGKNNMFRKRWCQRILKCNHNQNMRIIQRQIRLFTCLRIGIIQKLISMPKRQERTAPKRRYARISLKKRKILVRMVTEEGQSIANSIKKLRLKLTTARLILQKYKETGAFPMRKFKKVGKMLLDLQEDPVKEQQVYGEDLLEEYRPETVKEEFQSEKDIGYFLKMQENQLNSSNDQNVDLKRREVVFEQK